MPPSRTILYIGTYERDYPRNRQLIHLLRRNGARVIEIHRPVWERIGDKTTGLRSASAMMRLSLQLAFAYTTLVIRLLLHLRQADAVAIGYIGQLDMLMLGPLVRFVKKPLMFNPLVTLTDTVVEDRGLVAEQSVPGRLVRLLDKIALRLATVVVVDTPENANYLTERFALPQSRICQIDVGADEDVFRGAASRETRRNGDDVHVLFYGKMIPLHGVETILDAADRLSERAGISFEVVGRGQLEGQVHGFLAGNDPSNVTYRPWVAYPRLPQRIASADGVLGIFGTGAKAGRVIPNKVYQTMAMGAPIITRDSAAIRRVLVDGESALLVPPGDPTALAEAIERLRDPHLRDRLGRNARQAFEQFGSEDVLTGRVGELLDRFVPVVEPAEQQ